MLNASRFLRKTRLIELTSFSKNAIIDTMVTSSYRMIQKLLTIHVKDKYLDF